MYLVPIYNKFDKNFKVFRSWKLSSKYIEIFGLNNFIKCLEYKYDISHGFSHGFDHLHVIETLLNFLYLMCSKRTVLIDLQ